MLVCVCVYASVLVALSYPLCGVCLWRIRGDPYGTGIYNRPAGPSLCDDKALRVLCERLCVRICPGVCVYPIRLLSIGIPVYGSGEILINHI